MLNGNINISPTKKVTRLLAGIALMTAYASLICSWKITDTA